MLLQCLHPAAALNETSSLGHVKAKTATGREGSGALFVKHCFMCVNGQTLPRQMSASCGVSPSHCNDLKPQSTQEGWVPLTAENQHTRFDDNGQEVRAAGSSSMALITIDGWLHLRLGLQYVAHLCCLRHRLAQAFAAKVCLCSSVGHPHRADKGNIGFRLCAFTANCWLWSGLYDRSIALLRDVVGNLGIWPKRRKQIAQQLIAEQRATEFPSSCIAVHGFASTAKFAIDTQVVPL